MIKLWRLIKNLPEIMKIDAKRRKNAMRTDKSQQTKLIGFSSQPNEHPLLLTDTTEFAFENLITVSRDHQVIQQGRWNEEKIRIVVNMNLVVSSKML
jgi:hypothetical protein